MIRTVAAAVGLMAAAPALAQHEGHAMPMPATPAPAPAPAPALAHSPEQSPAPSPTQSPPDPHAGHTMPGRVIDPHAGHVMPRPAPDPHAGHVMPGAPAAGTDLRAGTAPAPAIPHDRWSDRHYGPAAMAASERRMMAEDGAQRFAQLFFNLAEIQPGRGAETYRWDGEGWYGGDRDRAVIKTEGEGRGGQRAQGEVQALFSRAIGPYFDLQAGVRQDFGRGADRTFATLGAEGLAPYWFETEAALFLSTEGEVHARIQGWYDQRITQRLILQPRAEIDLAAQDVPATRTGAGLSQVELGLRLRYELSRKFAPYVGVAWEARTGRSARYARADGDAADTLGLVAGIRFWF